MLEELAAALTFVPVGLLLELILVAGGIGCYGAALLLVRDEGAALLLLVVVFATLVAGAFAPPGTTVVGDTKPFVLFGTKFDVLEGLFAAAVLFVAISGDFEGAGWAWPPLGTKLDVDCGLAAVL